MDISELQDSELVALVVSGDNDAFEELHKRTRGVYIDCVDRYARSALAHVRKDLIEDCRFEIFRLALEFDPSKGMKFSTFLFQKTRWRLITMFKNAQKTSQITDFNIDKDSSDSYEDTRPEELDTICKISEKLSDKDDLIKKLFDFRYNSEYPSEEQSWLAISKKLGISPNKCSYLHRKTIKQLRKEILC